MAKLPRRLAGSNVSPQRPLDDPAPKSAATPRRDNMEITGAGGDKGRAQSFQEKDASQDTDELRLDLAIEAVLSANDIDAVTRVSLNEMRAWINEADPRAVLASLYGRNLTHGLLSFVMPRLRHPEVLRAENHDALLEHLTSTFSAGPEDAVVREGVFVLQQELRRLVLLRQNRNSLIEG